MTDVVLPLMTKIDIAKINSESPNGKGNLDHVHVPTIDMTNTFHTIITHTKDSRNTQRPDRPNIAARSTIRDRIDTMRMRDGVTYRRIEIKTVGRGTKSKIEELMTKLERIRTKE